MITCPICGKLTAIHWPEHWVYRRGETYYCSDQCMDVSRNRDTKTLTELHRKRKGKDMPAAKITLFQKKKAVEIAIDGGNPLVFLEDCGAKNPSAAWFYIKKVLKEKNPELYSKLPDKLPPVKSDEEIIADAKEIVGEIYDSLNEAPEQTPTVKVDGPLNIETKEPEKIYVKLTPEGKKMIKEVIRETEKPLGFRVNPEEKKVAPLQYDDYTVRCIEGKYGKFYWDYEYNRLDWTSPEGEEVSLSPQGWRTFCTEVMPKVMAILGVPNDV